MKDLLIVGASGFGREVLGLAQAINGAKGENPPWRILGFSDPSFAAGVLIHGFPVWGNDETALQAVPQGTHFVVAVGEPQLRKKLAYLYESRGFIPATLLHPTALLSESVQLGHGSLVCARTTLTVDIEVGQHCVLNLHSTVGHDCRIGDFCVINPGVHLSGGTVLGEGAMMGTGAVTLPGTQVGAWARVGAGTTVTKDLPAGSTLIGTKTLFR